jgi:hypothetical protein
MFFFSSKKSKEEILRTYVLRMTDKGKLIKILEHPLYKFVSKDDQILSGEVEMDERFLEEKGKVIEEEEQRIKFLCLEFLKEMEKSKLR